MAGVDRSLRRRGASSRRAPRVGFLAAGAASSIPAKDVRGNVEDGVARARATCSTASTRSRAQFAEPRRRLRRSCSPSRRSVQEQIDRRDAWELDAHARAARWTRCACRRRRPRRRRRSPAASAAASRSAGCCSPQPDLLLLDEPTNHLDAESVAWLERFLEEYTGTVVAVTHDRYFLDNVAGWILELDRGKGIPFEGNYSSWLEQKQARLARRGEAGVGAPAHARSASSSGCAMSPTRAPGEGKARVTAYEKLLAEEQNVEARRASRSTSRPARGSATSSSRPTHVAKGFGDRLLFEDLTFSLPPRRHRRRHRPERRRQDDALPDDRRRGDSPTAARSGSATRSQLAYVDQARDALDAGEHGLEGDLRRART